MIKMIRAIHGWLGLLALPWVILLGLTGIYLNHTSYFLGLLPGSSYDEAQFDQWPAPQKLDIAGARAVAAAVYPNQQLKQRSAKRYHGRNVAIFDAPKGRVIVALDTGHYWVKTRFTRRTFDPSGRQIDFKIYWTSLFRYLHSRGWMDSTFGTWIVDVTGGLMVLFGLTGIVLLVGGRKGKAGGDSAPVIKVNRSNVPRPKRITLDD